MKNMGWGENTLGVCSQERKGWGGSSRVWAVTHFGFDK